MSATERTTDPSIADMVLDGNTYTLIGPNAPKIARGFIASRAASRTVAAEMQAELDDPFSALNDERNIVLTKNQLRQWIARLTGDKT